MRNRVEDLIITFSAFGLIIALIVSLGIVGFRLFEPPKTKLIASKVDFGVIQIVVQPGDTLWSIARVQVPNKDPRDVVGSIRYLNQLKSAEIFPGQVLNIETQIDVEPVRLARQSLSQ